MRSTRSVIIVVAIVQIAIGLCWLGLMASIEQPSNSTYFAVYGLLTVAAVSVVTRSNMFAILFCVLANALLAWLWLKGVRQLIPEIQQRGVDFVMVFSLIAVGAPILPCGINTFLFQRHARQVLKDVPTEAPIADAPEK